MSTALIVIPARLESTRLPRKLLLAETGKLLIEYAFEAADKTSYETMVVCDCQELADACHKMAALVSCCQHPNGTSRAAEAFDEFFADYVDGGDDFIVVVLQADEPEIDPATINQLVTELAEHHDWDCATAAVQRLSRRGVRVWMDRANVAWSFTRDLDDYPPQQAHYNPGEHIGIYAYRVPALRRYAEAGPCAAEVAESLEQLRALHIGLRMGVVLTDKHHTGIDTRADYDDFVERQRAVRS